MFEHYLWKTSTFVAWSMIFCGALLGYRRRRDKFSVMELAGTSVLMAWLILDLMIWELRLIEWTPDLFGDVARSYSRIQSIVATVAIPVFAVGYLGSKRATPTTSQVDSDHAA